MNTSSIQDLPHLTEQAGTRPGRHWSQTLLSYCEQVKTFSAHGFLLFLPVSVAFAQICLSLLALAYLIEMMATKRFLFPHNPINPALWTYIAVSIITTLFAPDVLTSLRGLDSLLTISVFYLFYLTIHDLKQLKKFLRLLMVYVTLAAFYGILQYYLEVDLFRLSKPVSFLKHLNNDLTAPVRITGFSSYMTFSGQLAMTLPVICACLLAVKHPLKKGLIAISLILMAFALLWTYTRSAWIGAICAIIPLGYLKWKKKFWLFMLILILLFLVFLLIVTLIQPEMFKRVVSMLSTKKNIERIYTWESSLYMIKDYFLTGIGKGTYAQHIAPYRTRYQFDFTSQAHAHNNLLQVAVEGGIPLLLCFLWLWGIIFRSLYRTVQQIPADQITLKFVSLGFLGSILAFFVQGFFEYNFGDSETAMMMWLFVAFALKLREFIVTQLRPGNE